MNQIELLCALEDGTWITDIVDIPEYVDRGDLNAVDTWTGSSLCSLPEYQGVILFSVYHWDE